MNDPVALHLEPFGAEIFQVRGVREVHEDLVVKLSHMIDGLIERDMDSLPPAYRLVQRDADEEGCLADAVPGNHDSDVSGTESAVDRVFEQSQRVSFVELLAVHRFTPRPRGSSRSRISPPVPCELPLEPEHIVKTPLCIQLFLARKNGDLSNNRTFRPAVPRCRP